ncbi:MAG: glycosyltransferase, partial [Mycobacteriales bacterium]
DPGWAPLVTVLVAARNEEAFIDRCLDSVLGQTYQDLEVLVIDGDSTDATAALVRRRAARDARVRLLVNPRRTIPVSLNLGVAAARGEVVVRVDGHATVCDTYVARAVEHLRSGQWQGAGGRVDAKGLTAAGRAIAVAMSSRFGIGNSIHHYGTTPVPADHVPFPAYPTALLREHGGWDEQLAVNQDFELDYRIGLAGGRLLYDPAMTIDYHCTQSVRAVFRQFRRYGRGKARVVQLHPESIRARHLAAPALVACWAVAGAAAFVTPPAAVGLALPYALGLTAASVATARQLPGWQERVRLPVVFVAMHGGWGLGFWEGTLARRRGRR